MRSVFPKATSGELNTSVNSRIRSLTFSFISGSLFKRSFSSRRSSLISSSARPSGSLTLLAFSSVVPRRMCLVGMISAI